MTGNRGMRRRVERSNLAGTRDGSEAWGEGTGDATPSTLSMGANSGDVKISAIPRGTWLSRRAIVAAVTSHSCPRSRKVRYGSIGERCMGHADCCCVPDAGFGTGGRGFLGGLGKSGLTDPKCDMSFAKFGMSKRQIDMSKRQISMSIFEKDVSIFPSDVSNARKRVTSLEATRRIAGSTCRIVESTC
jgi:hypothetical protein